jgi:tricorn protease
MTYLPFPLQFRRSLNLVLYFFLLVLAANAQGTRLLRQPSLNADKVAFIYGADLWVSDLDGRQVVRITSTPAVESNPHFSPDGKWLAFTSNRSGAQAVYIVPVSGGEPKRLTWYPSSAAVRGWTKDGNAVLYATDRETAPVPFNRLYTVPVSGGPSTLLSRQWGNDASFSPDGKQLIVDKMDRWDVEWRAYRGGQNTPLILLNLADQSETLLPNPSSTDIKPLWLGDNIYFLSDRLGGVSNIWSYNPSTGALQQLTKFTGADVKWIAGNGNRLIFEREGYLHLHELASGNTRQLSFTVSGDFPWAETKWQNVGDDINLVALSPSGMRAIVDARGDIFTLPAENGDVRNITQSSGAADRAPIWSPLGDKIAWFSDADGKGYALMIAPQDGMGKPRAISMGESKMAWEPVWSADGKYIAFADNRVRVRVVDVTAGTIETIDTAGNNLERGDMGLTWSPDGKWLAYSKAGSNQLKGIKVWNVATKTVRPLTNAFADAFSPAWDRDGKHLYFLASTEVALGSGWANTSSQMARPEYEAYVINLLKTDQSPFKLKSDEEEVKPADTEKKPDGTAESKKDAAKKDEKGKGKKATTETDKPKEKKLEVLIDFENIERRTIPLGMPKRNYANMAAGPSGTVFISERIANKPGAVVHKFTLESKEAKEFLSGVNALTVSADGKKMLVNAMGQWKIAGTSGPSGSDAKPLKTDLKMQLDRSQEWKQMFEEAWRYEKDYFYDQQGIHGRNWDEVYQRYAPLVPFIKHRDDLTYILDMVNGELSVGHSFVFGGDFPATDRSSAAVLGADLVADSNRWKINRIYHTESWNPGLSSPLDRPGIKAEAGYFLVGVNGKEITAADDPYKTLDGTADVQTVLHLNSKPVFEGSWTEIVKPLRSESGLRQRTWVEDNRRMVDSLSGGKLGYIWVPNTGGPGFVSFNRYFFAQQDKQGAVIDERFNGGGLLDDYMTDLMTRSLRAAITNEVPGGKPLKLPAGILGPKALLINELAGSGGDFFPWVFRHQKAGPLIGMRTWGGLVKSSVHYSLVDGGALTSPDNAIFDPATNKWVAENEGVAPDIEVRQDAKSLEQGRDPQLERAVKEVLIMLEKQPVKEVKAPVYPKPAQTKQ